MDSNGVWGRNMGLEGKEGMEKLEGRYLRWVLELEGQIPEYMVREELQRDKIRGRTGNRA